MNAKTPPLRGDSRLLISYRDADKQTVILVSIRCRVAVWIMGHASVAFAAILAWLMKQ